jgi:hypothetical protein
MSRGIWDEGYAEVIDAINQSREMKPCPYIPGSVAELDWQDGVNAAWDDECPIRGDSK